MRKEWQVPDTWQWTKLGEVTRVVGGGTPKSSEPNYWNGDIPWLTPADLSGYHRKTIGRGSRNISAAGLDRSAAQLLPTGTVLFSSRAPIGYVAIAANPVATNQGFKSFVPPPQVCSSFLYYYLRSAKSLAVQSASGTTFKELSKTRAALLPFPLAPLSEQRRIVARIESLFARLDEGIGPLRRAKHNLERYRAAVLRAAVQGRLTDRWRMEEPPEESGDLLLARIGRTAVDGFGPPFGRSHEDLPAGWASAPLAMLIREPLRNGKSARASSDGQGVRTLTLSAVTEGDFSERNTKVTAVDGRKVSNLWLEAGDIFIERSNTPELVGLARMYCGPADYAIFPDLLIRVRCDRRISAAFVELCLQSPDARSYFRSRARGSSGSMPKINQTTVAELTLPLPARVEQDEIVARCRSILSEVERRRRVLAVASRRVASLRQSILSRAFEGRLIAQDPNDEPASVLIERIRVERKRKKKRNKQRRPTKPNRQPESRVS